MVFEGILVDVLNRFLGPYVKNLNASQLKVGIWGGDVVLNTLELKENALDDLDLPVRIFGGHLYKLRLKIPWKNLYSAPVVAEVDGLYILAGPASAAKYDAEKEAKEKKEAKDKKLAKIEEARKKNKEDNKEQTDPGFVEKLVTQIVKNVQITVKNIHISYEDAVTNPSNPLSFGVTLDSLFVQSTGSDYKIGDGSSSSDDPVTSLIYKVIQMNCLGVYWNSHVNLLGPSPPPNWTDVLKERIARPGEKLPPDIHYIVRPISAEAKLQLSLKAGKDPDIPQALVGVVLDEVAVALEKEQFRGAMSLVESLDRMSINRKYLKYKPPVGLRESPRAWWGYAIQAVLEEDVKRRTQMWSWKHIREHRRRCREYTELYTKKLLAGNSVSADLKAKLEALEEKLDVLNITICRQQAETEASRERERKEVAKSEQSWWSWATGWATGSEAPTTDFKPPTEKEIAEERTKLYEAIGYSETAKLTTYSEQYVAHRLNFDLKQVSLTLCSEEGRVAQLSTLQLHAEMHHRPSSSNIGVKASVDELSMTGWSYGSGKEEPPVIISTKKETEADHLLDVEFDLNPLKTDEDLHKVDQRIRARLLPIQVVYDADTVDKIVDMFLLPRNVQLQKLSASATSTLEELRTQTRAGLEHSISLSKLLDVDIILNSPRVLVPENGRMSSSSSVLLADLGSLRVTSDMKFAVPDVRDASRAELEEASYDHFNVSLSAVQLIIAGAGDDWEGARKMATSPYHILSPLGFDVQLKKSKLSNDTNLPSFIVNGKLPSISLDLSDKKLKQVLQLVQSIPIPPPSFNNRDEAVSYSYQAEPVAMGVDGIIGSLSTSVLGKTEEDVPGASSVDKAGSSVREVGDDPDDWFTADEGVYDEHGRLVYSDGYLEKLEIAERERKQKKEGEVKSATNLELQFDLDEVCINFSEHSKLLESDSLAHPTAPRLSLVVSAVKAKVRQTTWNLVVTASMDSVAVKDYFSDGGGVSEGVEPRLLLSAAAEGELNKGQFLSMEYTKNERVAPHYTTTMECTQQSIAVELSMVRLNLQRESMANLLAVMKSIAAVLKAKDESLPVGEGVETAKPTPSEGEKKTSQLKPPRFDGEKDLSLMAKLAGIELTLSDKAGDLLMADIKDLGTTVDMLEDSIEVKTSIKHIGLVDEENNCHHPEVITEVDKEGNIIEAEVVVFKNPSKDLDSSELSITAGIQRLKVTVCFRFLNRVKEFSTEFLSDLQLDSETIETARKAAVETATKTAEALKEQSSSRVKLDVTIHAPLVCLPLSASSQSALVANLGSLKVTNKFLEACAVAEETGSGQPSETRGFVSSSGQKAIVDKMAILLTSIQLGRVENLTEDDIGAIADDHMILKPIKFSGHVTRLLSGWCKEVPAIDVGADLEALEVQFSPRDFQAVMKLLDSMNDGKRVDESAGEEDKTSEVSPKDRDDEKKDEEVHEASAEEEQAAVSNIHVTANIAFIRLLLHSKEGQLADVKVEDLCTDVDLKDETIIVKASIRGIGVTDLSNVTRYPQIVSVAENAKALDAVVGVYPKATKTSHGLLDMSKHDLGVTATVGQVKIVVLFLFINRLLSYLKQFNVSEDAIESARKSAQEGASAAVTAVQETHASGQRIKLDVSIQAPEITIPLKSDSNQAIVADLGSLSLSNTFHIAKQFDATSPESSGAQSVVAIYERHAIKLNNLKIFRTLLLSDTESSSVAEPEQLIVMPFNFSTVLERNLSASWYREIPTIKVDAKLDDLKVVASGDDIESVCLILSGNLREGVVAVSDEESARTENKGGDENKDQPTKAESEDKKEDGTEEAKPEEKAFETLNVSATLRSIEIALYKASSSDEISGRRDPADSLAQLTLEKFELDTKMKSNGEMSVTVSMNDCLLDDKRQGKTSGITRLIQGTSTASGDGNNNPDPLVDFKFTKSDTNDSYVVATVNDIEVLVDLPFILMLKDFAMTSIEPLTSPAETIEPETAADVEDTGVSLSLSPEKSKEVSPVPAVEPPSSSSREAAPSQGKLNVEAKIKRPIIALVEDAQDSDSRALVLNVSDVAFTMRSRGSNINVYSSISGLFISSSRASNLRNTAIKVLSPTRGPITATFDSFDNSSTEIDLQVPALAFTFSPTTVRLILKVVKSLQPETKEEDEVIGETAPSDLWEPKQLDKSLWYFQSEDKTKMINLEPGSSVDMLMAPPDPTSLKSEFMKLFVEKVNIIVEQELPDSGTYPVVAMTLGKYHRQALEMNVYNWSNEMKAKAELTVEISYYNLLHDAWEPILEPVIKPDDESNYLPWTLLAEMNKHATVPLANRRDARIESDGENKKGQKDKEDLPAQVEISVSSKSALQLTVTKTSLGVIKELSKAYQEDISLLSTVTVETDAIAPETQEPLYFFKHELGKRVTVNVKPSATLKVHGAYVSKLDHDRKIPLHPIDKVAKVTPGELLPRSTHLKRAHIVTLEIGKFKPVDIVLGTSDLVYYPIVPRDADPKKKGALTYGIVVEITRNVGETIPIVTVRSPIKVTNHLDESVSIFWSDEGQAVSASKIGFAGKDDSYCVPLAIFDHPQGGLFLQPDVLNSGLSNKPIKWSGKDELKSVELQCYSTSRAVEGKSRCKAFFIHVDVKEEKYSKKPPISLENRSHHVINLHYPLVVHNLLPYPIEVMENASGSEKRSLKPGEVTHYSHTTVENEPRFLTTLKYGRLEWSGEFQVENNNDKQTKFDLHSVKETESSALLSPKRQILGEETQSLFVEKEVKGTWHLSILSPYWMINKTKFTLQYGTRWSGDVITHPPDVNIALYAKEKTRVRVVIDEEQKLMSEWSDEFSLDAVGSEGIFKCEVDDSDRVYQFGSTVKLSSGAFSKTVTLSPLFMAYNKTRDDIYLRLEVSNGGDSVDEERGPPDSVIKVPPNELVPFWPQSGVHSMHIAVNDPTVTKGTKTFKFTATTSLLLRCNNEKSPAVVVEINVTGSANIVSFSPYYVGSVPFRLVNDTDFSIELKQSTLKVKEPFVLLPDQSILYTWDEPSDFRALSWKLYKHKKGPSMVNIMTKDQSGEFPFPKILSRESTDSIESSAILSESVSSVDFEPESSADVLQDIGEEDEHAEHVYKPEPGAEEDVDSPSLSKTLKRFRMGTVGRMSSAIKRKLHRRKGNTGYWVSFQDGLQRTVLFTASKEIRDRVLLGNRTEQPTVDVTLSLIAVGLSLVNDVKGIEVAYIGIPQSKLHWEIEKRSNRFKGVSHELQVTLEKLYEEAKLEKKSDVTDVPDHSEYKVDFRDLEDMKLIEKGRAKKLRRLHMEGLRVELTVCEHSIAIETKINEVQIDNHLLFSPNPTILYAYPPRPELASKYAPKPFIDSVVILRKSEHSTEIQLLQVLIQEMGVNIDLNFILAVTGLLASLPNVQTDADVIQEDIKHSEKPLEKTIVAQASAASSRTYFNFLHLSPLDIHLSFSLDRDPDLEEESKAESEGNIIIRAILNVLNHFASIIGSAKDAELKLGYFQLENTALTRDALVDRITKHYVQQAVLQVYKIIFGLELLGNPVGFVTGVKDGAISLFYYPIQGAVLGPGEFFQGLALGGQQFFAGTIGGVSGALGKVVGVLAKTTTKLTMDEEFQEKRKRAGAGGVRQGLEGAARGVLAGVAGVVTQPIKGARKGGFLGAISGLGKGAVGLFLRPATGLLDLTSATLTVVQKKTQIGDYEVEQVRTARFIGPEKIVYPFSPHMSTGYALFLSYDNGRLIDSDTFFDYVELVEEPLKALLITNMRFALIKYSSLRGKWEDDLIFSFQNLDKPTTAKGKVISMQIWEEGLGFGLFGGSKKIETKTLTVLTPELAQASSSLINQAYKEYTTTVQIFRQE